MAFKELLDNSTDTTISLGGTNRKTNKVNPTSIEGYYLGSRKVEDNKKKTGFSYIHVFQTAKGNVGVWGKTDMDRKVITVPVGTMTRVAYDRMRPTQNGEMYVYKVAVDETNTIDTGTSIQQEASNSEEESLTEGFDSSVDETDINAEEEALDEAPPSRSLPPKVAAKAPDAARQAKVAALLNRSKAS